MGNILNTKLLKQVQRKLEDVGIDAQDHKELIDIALGESLTSVIDNAVVQTDIENKLAAKEAQYAPRLTATELATKSPYISKGIQKAGLRPKPIVVFTFDDGSVEDLTVMKPIFDSYGYKATAFIVTGWMGQTVGGNDYMTAEQLLHLHNAGWEIGSHTVTHLNCQTSPIDVVEEEMKQSKEHLESLGIPCSNFAYPYGAMNGAAKRISQKYYRTASNYMAPMAPNVIPIKKESLNRRALGSSFENPTAEYPVTDTFEGFYKPWIDRAINNTELCVFALHSRPLSQSETQMQYLLQTLDYCRDNNVTVLTLNEALEYWDNLFYATVYDSETGDVSTSFVVDALGSPNMKDVILTKVVPRTDFSNDSPPSAYPDFSVSQFQVNGPSFGFPENQALILTYKPNNWADSAMQFCIKKWGEGIKYRRADTDGAWRAWQDILVTVFEKNNYKPLTANTVLSAKDELKFQITTGIPWNAAVYVSPSRRLPKGVVYHAYNNGSEVALVLYNTTDDNITLTASGLEFNVKIV